MMGPVPDDADDAAEAMDVEASKAGDEALDMELWQGDGARP